MPRKTILSSRPHPNPGQRAMPNVEVRWGSRGQDVQIGLSTPDEGGAGTGQHHLVTYWYGDAPTLLAIGEKAYDWVFQFRGDTPRWDTEDERVDILTAWGRAVLDMVTGSSPQGGVSWWTDLDRDGLQQLVAHARSARNGVYGRDE